MSESESICKECGHPTEWAQDIGSAVCTQCGTLADPSQQSALASAQESFPRDDILSYAPPTALKSIRRNAAWDLPGQSSCSRNDRNKLTIHNLISTLSDRLGYHGVATRAQAIFTSIMQRTSIKWGKAAKLAAAAAVVFAMREQGRGDRTHHVAVLCCLTQAWCSMAQAAVPFRLLARRQRQPILVVPSGDGLMANPGLRVIHLLSEPIIALKRTQLHLLPHLNLALPRTNPCVHLPALSSHLSVLASTSPTSLPKDTLAFLRPLLSATSLQGVLRSARSLYDLTTLESRISTGTSAGATACALLLLSLEAHAGPPRPVPHALVLAAQLGAAIGARGAAVMARYRILTDFIEADAARVPWLAGVSATGSKRVSRRSWVAKAVLDVLQFHNQLEQTEIAQRGGPVGVEIEGDDDVDDIERENQGEDEATLDARIAIVELKIADSTGSMSRAFRDTLSTTGTTMEPVRRYKKLRTATTQAASFLLDPLAHSAPARATLAHTTYLLSSDTASEPAVLPTRLQLLAVERGDAEAIHDDELFGDGELEGIVIGTDEQAGEERERRARALQMVWGDEHAETTEEDLGVETVQAERKKRKDRVDMNKLAAFLDSDDPFVALGIEESSPCDEGGGEVGDGDSASGGGRGIFMGLDDTEWE